MPTNKELIHEPLLSYLFNAASTPFSYPMPTEDFDERERWDRAQRSIWTSECISRFELEALHKFDMIRWLSWEGSQCSP